LLGALAGSGALPFPRETYEATISASGRGVKASLAAFAGGFDGARGVGPEVSTLDERPATAASAGPADVRKVAGPDRLVDGWRHLIARIERLPEEARDMAQHGLRKVVDFQDAAYGREYLDRLE